MNENMEAELFRYIESIAIHTEQIATSLAKIEAVLCNPLVYSNAAVGVRGHMTTAEELKELLKESDLPYIVNPDGTTRLSSSAAPPSSGPAPDPGAGTEGLQAQASAPPHQK